jgi:GNAT superfamily N-acetyltransferase
MIKVVKTRYQDVKDFSARQWRSVDIEHYGEAVDWKKRKLILKAVDGKEIVGVIKIKMESGVADIESVLVAEDRRGEGVGTALMKQAEKEVKSRGCHIIELVTGADWKAVEFYKNLGYKQLSFIITTTTEISSSSLNISNFPLRSIIASKREAAIQLAGGFT